MKKKVVMMFLAVLAIFSATTAMAGGGGIVKTAYQNSYNVLYEISIPSDVNDSRVVVEEIAGEYSECEGTPVLSKYINFMLAVNVPKLTKWNFGTASLSGIGGEGNNGRFANLTGHLSFEPGIAYITFAGQYCRQKAVQNYNYDTQQWECVVSTEFSCYDAEYYLEGEVVLTVEPYARVR